ncbi:MAG: lysophospholipid acyltransferase family protein [Deltaproteobacteria bacterium]|nr:lysophospholipid acyltransferase family protein [Deltaproteobacteria bacterium]
MSENGVKGGLGNGGSPGGGSPGDGSTGGASPGDGSTGHGLGNGGALGGGLGNERFVGRGEAKDGLLARGLRRFLIGAFMAATWVLAHLPRRLGLALGDLGGLAFYWLGARRRKIAWENIQRAKGRGALPGDLDEKSVAKKSFEGLGRTAMESFCLLHRGLGYFKGRLGFENEGLVPAVLAKCRENGRGVIFITAHSGNWELSPAALAEKFDCHIWVVGRTQGSLWDEILAKIRSHGRAGFITKDGGAKAMLGILKSGGVLGTLFDQAAMVGRGIAKLTFMGSPALTTLGPLKLAALTGSTVIPLFCRRAGQGHVIEFSDPIEPPERFDRGWLVNQAQKLNDLLEDFIRRHPGEWMWSHRRWKMPSSRKEELPKGDTPGQQGTA